MTTCAWDGKKLSADTRSVTGDVIDQSACQKIFQRKGVFCAAAGDLAEAISVVKYLLNKKGEPPDFEEGSFEIMLVSETRSEFYGGTLKPVPMEAPSAIGSGGSYAIAAMLCGKSAPNAVRIAAKMDSNTGVDFGVRTFRVR